MVLKIKDIFQVAAAFAVPLFAIEILHAWRTYRGQNSILDEIHRQSRKRRKSGSKSKKRRFGFSSKDKSKSYEHNDNTSSSKSKSRMTTINEQSGENTQNSQNSSKQKTYGFSESEIHLASTSQIKSNSKEYNNMKQKITREYPQTCPEEVTETEESSDQEDDYSVSQSENVTQSDSELDTRGSKEHGQGDSPYKQNSHSKKNNSTISDALFFPEKSKQPPCKDYYFTGGCPRRNCTESHDMNSGIGKLVNYIFRTRDCIDVCQYTVTSSFLADAILARHRLGFGFWRIIHN